MPRLFVMTWSSCLQSLADPLSTQQEPPVARRRVELAKARAPVAGIVEQLRIYTIKGDTKSGEELLRGVLPGEVSHDAADSMELKAGV